MPLSVLSQVPEPVLPATGYDVRGWAVRTLVDGERVGTVHDLIVADGGRPVYLDLALERLGRHVLLPIGDARADPRRRRVWLPGLHAASLAGVPAYAHDPEALTRADEHVLLHAYRLALTGEAAAGPAAVVCSPPAGAGPGLPRLAPISQLPDFRVVHGDTDPRGWTVRGAGGERIGTLSDLVVDTRELKVRYLVCDVDEEALGLEPVGRRILVPAELARLGDGVVEAAQLPREEVGRIPVYVGQALNRKLEEELLRSYRAGTAHGRFYDQPRFDARGFFGSGPA